MRLSAVRAMPRPRVDAHPVLERLDDRILLSNAPPVVNFMPPNSGGAALLDDINPGPNPSFPSSLTVAGGRLFFLATPGAATYSQVFAGDGTAAGTQSVAPSLNATAMTALGSSVIFTAYDTAAGQFGLWTSDGTSAGTHVLAPLPPSSPDTAITAGAHAFFEIYDSAAGQYELWSSDGTPSGTGEVAVLPDMGNNYTASGGRVFFTDDDATHGNELWTSDGTVAGTGLVADIRPGSLGSNPAHLTDVNGTLFFTATDGTTAYRQLWKSDGTAAGTVKVATTLKPYQLANDGGQLVFTAKDQSTSPATTGLWQSDGTTTSLIAALPASTPGGALGVAGGEVFFTINPSGSSSFQLWTSDGTAGGAAEVATLEQDASSFTPSGGTLYFVTSDAAHGNELWSTDGTTAGTGLVADINPGPNDSGPAELTPFGGVVVFSADDGVHGDELWATVPVAPPPVTTIHEGDTFTDAEASFSDDPANGPWTATVDYGDGSGPQPLALNPDNSFLLSHPYEDDGVYTVTVTVTDAGGISGSGSLTVTVLNVAPTASIVSIPSISPEGTPITLQGSATDPGAIDAAAGFTYAWSVTQDGQPWTTGSGASFTITPNDEGTYVVTLTATDEDGLTSAPVTATIDVTNVPPTPAILGAPASSPQGTAIALTASATDPSSVDTAAGFTYSWTATDNGQAYASGTGTSFTLNPTSAGTYVVTLIATDEDGQTGSTTATTVVSPSGPAASISGDSTGVRGQPRHLILSATSPSPSGSSGGFGYLVDWGDGTPVQSIAVGTSPKVGHIFTAAGTYTVEVRAVASDGTIGQPTSWSISIAAALLEPDPRNLGASMLVIGGTTGNDLIRLAPASLAGSVDVQVDGVDLGSFGPSDRIRIYGQGGWDVVVAARGIHEPIQFAGHDWDDDDRPDCDLVDAILDALAQDGLLGKHWRVVWPR